MKKQTVVVIGCNGFIGSRIIDKLNSQFTLIGLGHNEIDITDKAKVFDVLGSLNCDWIIHAAAKAHIDNCEKDRLMGEESDSWKVNVEGSNNIALACAKFGKRLLFLSTECVFDGKKRFKKESDKPNPINWYGETKYKGERKVIESGSLFCILRAVLAYGHPHVFKNDLTRIFYENISKKNTFKVVSDQYMNVTFIDDLIDAISNIFKYNAEGIYHFGGDKSLSPYEIAVKIKKAFHIKDAVLIPVTLSEYYGKDSNLRLINSTLSCDRIQNDFGVKLSNFDKAINLLKNCY